MKKAAMVTTLIAVTLMLAWAIPAMSDETDRVNINTAIREQLMTLEGVGESYADRIIEYRKQNGPFQKPEDILKVKGIGQKTFEANKDRIVVQENPGKIQGKPSK